MERKLIAVAVSTALGLPLAANAVEFSLSGHVNRAATLINQDGHADDGDIKLVDANGSETRFRMTGSEELDNGVTVGLQFELGAAGGEEGGGNYGHTAHADDDMAHTSGDIRVRHSNVYLSSAAGTLTLGRGGPGADGAGFADVGSSWIAGATNWCSYGGGSGPACPSNSGARQENIRYDTPAIGPASVRVSAGNSEYWDAQVRVGGSFGDSSYDLRIAYIDDVEAVTGSAAFAMGQGTGVAVAWSQADATSNGEHQYGYVKLDHSYGDGSVGIYYKRGEDDRGDGSLWGIGVGHSLGGGATVYAGYRFVEADNQNDLDLLLAGMRVTFN